MDRYRYTHSGGAPRAGVELGLEGRTCGKELVLVGTQAVVLWRAVLKMLVGQGGLWLQSRAQLASQMLPRAAQGCRPRHVIHSCPGKGILGAISQHRSGFLLRWSGSVMSFAAVHFGFNF